MKKHTIIYLKFLGLDGYDSYDQMPKPMCEWCGVRPVDDVNHIEPRGMGGSKTKDYIENLIGMCRLDHLKFEAKEISKEELIEKHIEWMRTQEDYL